MDTKKRILEAIDRIESRVREKHDLPDFVLDRDDVINICVVEANPVATAKQKMKVSIKIAERIVKRIKRGKR